MYVPNIVGNFFWIVKFSMSRISCREVWRQKWQRQPLMDCYICCHHCCNYDQAECYHVAERLQNTRISTEWNNVLFELLINIKTYWYNCVSWFDIVIKVRKKYFFILRVVSISRVYPFMIYKKGFGYVKNFWININKANTLCS